jgi:hypothetical protein
MLSIHLRLGLPSGLFPFGVIQRYQNKVLKCIVNTPWYVRNSDHHDLGIGKVTDIIANFSRKETSRPHQHRSVQASQREQCQKTTEAEETV